MQPPAPTRGGERKRAKHLGVVGHDAADPDAEAAVVARGMVEKRRCIGVAFVAEHLGKRHARTTVDRDKRRFVADAADMILRIAGDAVSHVLDARQLLVVDVQKIARSANVPIPTCSGVAFPIIPIL